MADRNDWDRDRERERRGHGDRGDWGGSERGWEGRSRPEHWDADRRSERGGLDRGYPPQNREEWGSRSSWGYGARGHEEMDRDRERETPWSGENRSHVDWQGEYRRQEPGFDRERGREVGWREGSWNEGLFGGRERGRERSWNEPRSGGMDRWGEYGGPGSLSGRIAGGRFAGRGPKNWQRSDERIRDDIGERLMRHPDIDATDIEIAVASGDVTLSGLADDRAARRLAEELVENVTGVKNVQNNLRLRQYTGGAAHSSPEVSAGGTKPNR